MTQGNSVVLAAASFALAAALPINGLCGSASTSISEDQPDMVDGIVSYGKKDKTSKLPPNAVKLPAASSVGNLLAKEGTSSLLPSRVARTQAASTSSGKRNFWCVPKSAEDGLPSTPTSSGIRQIASSTGGPKVEGSSSTEKQQLNFQQKRSLLTQQLRPHSPSTTFNLPKKTDSAGSARTLAAGTIANTSSTSTNVNIEDLYAKINPKTKVNRIRNDNKLRNIAEESLDSVPPKVPSRKTPSTGIYENFPRKTSPSTGIYENFPRKTSPSTGIYENFPRKTSPSTGIYENFPRKTSPSTGIYENVPRKTSPSTGVYENVPRKTSPSAAIYENVLRKTSPSTGICENALRTSPKEQASDVLYASLDLAKNFPSQSQKPQKPDDNVIYAEIAHVTSPPKQVQSPDDSNADSSTERIWVHRRRKGRFFGLPL